MSKRNSCACWPPCTWKTSQRQKCFSGEPVPIQDAANAPSNNLITPFFRFSSLMTIFNQAEQKRKGRLPLLCGIVASVPSADCGATGCHMRFNASEICRLRLTSSYGIIYCVLIPPDPVQGSRFPLYLFKQWKQEIPR